jgi:hypothetical protein
MRTRKGTWLVILVAGVVFLLSGAVTAPAYDGFKAKPMDDGYGDFHKLFIQAGSAADDRGLTSSPAYDLSDRGVAPLAYAIPEPHLPYNFAWLSLALDKGSRIVLSQVFALVVTPPISGAALLLRSGILCLIGLRRRDRHQA